MSAPSDLRAEIQNLRIDKAQRPIVESDAAARPRRRLIFALIALAAVIAAGYGLRGVWSGLASGASDAPPVRVMMVAPQRETGGVPVLTATGKIVSDHKVQVSTKVSGQIVELLFEQGDPVRKGQVIARIEDVVYRARRDEAAAMLEKSRATLEFQEVNFARIQRLYDEKRAPTIEWADARRALDEARAQVAASQAALDFAQKALNDCEVVAPITGVILERNVEVGDFVAAEGGRGAMANAQFASIADMQTLRVEVDISELDIARVHKGMRCKVTPDAYKDRAYAGHVMWLDPGANYSKATVQAKVRIENPDHYLRVEGSAQVAFLSDEPAAEARAAIWIPATACRHGESAGAATVFVVVDGRARSFPIRIGKQVGDRVEVLDGLKAGQTIAVEGVEKIRDGQRLATAS